MGRHEPAAGRRGIRTTIVVTAAVLVAAAGGWVTVARVTASAGCAQEDVVRVAVAPDLAAAVDRIAHGVAAGQCFRFEVEDRDPAAVASSLAVADGTRRPDVWIPDSTLRLRRAKAAGAADVPVSGSSVANSPVVFAMTEDTAKSLGWPGKTPAWQDLLDSPVSLGMPDPGSDPVGVSTLLGVAKALPPGPAAAPAFAAAMRRLAPITLPGVDDLYARLPGAGSSKQAVSAFPASETSVLRYNERAGVTATPAQLVAVYPPQAVPSLDYPFAVLGNAGRAQQDAAAKLLTALLGADGQAVLAGVDVRTPDGRMLFGHTGDTHVAAGPQALSPLPSEDALDQVLNQWAKVNTSSRARVLIDISGSMNAIVPGTGRTRMALTAEAAARALDLFKPTSESSTWVFSTNLDGDHDYREVLPMSPVSVQLATGAAQKLRDLRATPNGQTGLYDTVLAAYQQARADWTAGRLNLVILMTDGRNEDPHGVTREQLLDGLNALQDPRRPLPVIAIGMGPDIDAGDLGAITAATGGKTFVAPDPAKIADVFYGALAGLSCPTPGCT
ncbi:substrate-binding domain-containing protein [Amycolatopsis sp. GM8]|uniref:substrate-binding domain-containing protein n=1 Tax=Amycolatopsis sp. GM8 TaxID=2896530 RepID=UPI001F1E6B24|nr:substrate-binding domain-containing protein [Amycolatopsis sp. GM8]